MIVFILISGLLGNEEVFLGDIGCPQLSLYVRPACGGWERLTHSQSSLLKKVVRRKERQKKKERRLLLIISHETTRNEFMEDVPTGL